MPYKTILVHVDDTGLSDAGVEAAARLAVDHGAHLVGLSVGGVREALLHTSSALAAAAPGLAPYRDNARDRQAAARRRFESVAQGSGAAACEWQSADGSLPDVIAARARYADLLVVGLPEGSNGLDWASGLAEQLLAECPGPVLLLPQAGHAGPGFESVAIGWDGSLPAIGAVRGALPILQRAGSVLAVVLDPEDLGEGAVGDPPGAELRTYLARHGVDAHVRPVPGGRDPGRALLSRAADAGAGLLVMGCYGRSRLRQKLLGGTTRTVLGALTLPVLLARG